MSFRQQHLYTLRPVTKIEKNKILIAIPGNIMPKIMVVDDDKEFTFLYSRYLEMMGFEVIAENQSSKAMALANSARPDLFVIDLMMPDPDGFKLCRMLRANMSFMHTPIIIVTALNDEDSRVVAFGAGANEYLAKPFHIDDLKSRIDFLLEKFK